MLTKIKGILSPLAPSLICMGILRCQQNNYKAAQKNLIRGISLYCSVKDADLLHQAYLLLAEYRLGDISKLKEIKNMSLKLKNYSKDKVDSYWYAIEEINNILSS